MEQLLIQIFVLPKFSEIFAPPPPFQNPAYATDQQEEKCSSILEVKMPQHLSDEHRHLIVYLHKKAISERKIASEVGCSKTGVNVTIKRWKETGKIEERPGRGRKMKSTI